MMRDEGDNPILFFPDDGRAYPPGTIVRIERIRAAVSLTEDQDGDYRVDHCEPAPGSPGVLWVRLQRIRTPT